MKNDEFQCGAPPSHFWKARRTVLAITREISTIASVAMPIAEAWRIKRCRYAPEGASTGRLCIATGIHGDELMGQLILFGVAQQIMRQPECLCGVVDLYPMLNPLGLDGGTRMVPSTAELDMNRAFPGRPDGTALESICWNIIEDMKGADLVLDIHASAQNKSELYEVRLDASPAISAQTLIAHSRALCPDMIWAYPESHMYSGSLTATLCAQGTPALIIEADEQRRRPQEIARHIVDGIFCKMKDMGIWAGDCPLEAQNAQDIPCAHTRSDVCVVACEQPGIYVPQECIGRQVVQGELLGTLIDSLEGKVLEEVRAPMSGLVFSQCGYSVVYPGTLIARILKKEVEA